MRPIDDEHEVALAAFGNVGGGVDRKSLILTKTLVRAQGFEPWTY